MLQTARIEPRPSRIALGILLTLHISALGLLLVVDASLLPRLGLVIGVLMVAIWQIRQLGWFGGRLPLAALVCNTDGLKARWVDDRAESWHRVSLQADYVVCGWLVVLRVRDAARHRRASLILFADSANRNEMRRLRALLLARKLPCGRSLREGPSVFRSGVRGD